MSFFDTDKLLQHLQQCRKWLCVSAELWQMTCNCLSHLPQGNEVDDFITSGPKAGDFETYPSFWENAAAYKKKRLGISSQTPRRFVPNAKTFSFDGELLILTIRTVADFKGCGR